MKRILSLTLVLLMLLASFMLFSCNDNEEETEKTFTFTVVHNNGEEKSFTITSTKKTVGEALIDEGLIAGEDSQYGLYVKTVDGETLDYDTDGKYWAFYANGEYAMAGVDTTNIVDGAAYSFKAE